MGDSQFAHLLERHRSVMLKRARTLVGNGSDAEDVVQQALERAWRSRGRFVTGAKPVPWLLTITQNTALDLLRRRSASRVAVPGELPSADRPDESVLRRENAERIERAIRELAPSHRRTFVLHDLHGYSSREISTHLQMPYHTVRTHLRRARLRLRSTLTGAEL